MKLPASLPSRLGRLVGGGAAVFSPSAGAFDYAIGGLPWLSSANDQVAMERATAPYKKDQFDVTGEPGEHALDGWWYRSQTSFHNGAGLTYGDPDRQDLNLPTSVPELRFFKSAGVDVWTPGQVTLLPDSTLHYSAVPAQKVMGWSSGGSDGVLYAGGSSLWSNTEATATPVVWGGASTILSMTSDGTNYYVASATSIYKGAFPAGAGAALWNTGSAAVVLAWVKQRLVAAIGPAIYELVGGAPPTLPTAKYTHPNPSWVWTSITETGGAIYAAGYAGAESSIYRFSLDTSGVMPTLTSGIVAAQLPIGEQVLGLYGYLGTLLAVGTTRGLRIAAASDTTGNLEYGPLLFNAPLGVRSMVGRDRFLYATVPQGVDGSSGLYRVDLGAPIGSTVYLRSLRYAYASDLYVPGVNGDMTGVTLLGNDDRLVYTIDGQGGYLESVTQLIPSGYLQTSRVRYSTLEPKLFKLVRVRTPMPLVGDLAVSTIDASGTTTQIIRYASGSVPGTEDAAISNPSGPAEYVSLRFDLYRASGLLGGVMSSYQLKSLPGALRKRLFTIPVKCYDLETDRYGVEAGHLQSASERLEAMEGLDEAGQVVVFQDLNRGINYNVIIDGLRFVQTAPPGPDGEGWGGILVLTLRTV